MFLADELIFQAAEKSALADAEGAFAKQVAVLALCEPDSAQLREFLGKVLAAAHLDLSQDTLLAEIPSQEPHNIALDLRERKPRQVLVFGLPPRQLGLQLEMHPYQSVSFLDCTWLFADRVSVLEPDKVKKTQLWSALKKMFL